ncbi:MAG TPA: RES family NAD+ phosphorylase [Gemmatimonadaceae bacterium]|nr:RES family NAD+ phosphorylase [Gemmatimonadaceae bacterium]
MGASASFGVCYLGLSREAAFAESFLHPRIRVISRAAVDARAMTSVATSRPLQLVTLHGPGLAAVGAAAAVTHGPHATARRWARALWRHPARPDGLAYRCRHDDDELAVALFDHAVDALTEVARLGPRADLPWFGRTLDRYRLALEE